MPMPTWIDLPRPPVTGRLYVFLIVASLGLAGCQTNKEEMLPHGQNTMMDVWNQGTTGSAGSASSRQLLDARSELRRPIDVRATQPLQDNAAYTRTAQNEIYSQFKRLPIRILSCTCFRTLQVPIQHQSLATPLFSLSISACSTPCLASGLRTTDESFSTAQRARVPRPRPA